MSDGRGAVIDGYLDNVLYTTPMTVNERSRLGDIKLIFIHVLYVRVANSYAIYHI
jgi:hypothetical protein